MHVGNQPLHLHSRKTIGTYTAIAEVEPTTRKRLETKERNLHTICPVSHSEEVPLHLQEVYEQRRQQCTKQELQLSSLLKEYCDVLSTGEGDMGHTDLIKHSIPVRPGTKPIRL